MVASLWKVAELSTALLMRAFYGGLRDGRPPREALAAAQRHVRGLTSRDRAARDRRRCATPRSPLAATDPGAPADVPADFSHPYHWAGFVLIGL